MDSAGAPLVMAYRAVVILTKDITGTIIITPELFTRGFIIPVIIMPPGTPSGRGTIHIPATVIRPTAVIIITPRGPADTSIKVVDLKNTVEIITSASHTKVAVMAEVTKAGAKKAGAKKAVATEGVATTGFVDSFVHSRKGVPVQGRLFFMKE